MTSSLHSSYEVDWVIPINSIEIFILRILGYEKDVRGNAMNLILGLSEYWDQPGEGEFKKCVYNFTLYYWVFGSCPSHGIRSNAKFRQWGVFPS
jgi:hypothetical protein